MPETKPCPFCGSQNIHVMGQSYGYWVMCAYCGVEGPAPSTLWQTEKGAIEAWNRRYEE